MCVCKHTNIYLADTNHFAVEGRKLYTLPHCIITSVIHASSNLQMSVNLSCYDSMKLRLYGCNFLRTSMSFDV